MLKSIYKPISKGIISFLVQNKCFIRKFVNINVFLEFIVMMYIFSLHYKYSFFRMKMLKIIYKPKSKVRFYFITTKKLFYKEFSR